VRTHNCRVEEFVCDDNSYAVLSAGTNRGSQTDHNSRTTAQKVREHYERRSKNKKKRNKRLAANLKLDFDRIGALNIFAVFFFEKGWTIREQVEVELAGFEFDIGQMLGLTLRVTTPSRQSVP